MSRARWFGVLFQALILGSLLFLALGQLLAISADARIFRYQGF